MIGTEVIFKAVPSNSYVSKCIGIVDKHILILTSCVKVKIISPESEAFLVHWKQLSIKIIENNYPFCYFVCMYFSYICTFVDSIHERIEFDDDRIFLKHLNFLL